ncbi:MAG: zf-HC2 domain-containing protein [Rhodocyclaceae bacterium]|nr:zf-HC2 domain-containing protein [Rhodocyclaceae bacterium]
MIKDEIRQQFDDLLPWYVNGTLDERDRQWVERQLADNPDWQSELGWMHSLQAKIRESEPAFAPGQGFDRLLARVRHGQEVVQAPRPQPKAEGGLLAALSAWLERFSLTPALAGAAAVVMVQFGVIALLVNQQGELKSEYERFRSVNSGEVVTGPALEVVFKSDALEREIRETLVRIGGTLAGGPGQLGIYLVYVPENELSTAKAALEGNPIVELVTVSRNGRAAVEAGG